VGVIYFENQPGAFMQFWHPLIQKLTPSLPPFLPVQAGLELIQARMLKI
jgi:hypothetical protein